jgi:hypothetical protein
MKLTKEGREELALAIHLWKDFKNQGKMDIEIMKQALYFVKMLGVEKEFDDLHGKLPPLKIEPRYK